MELEGTEFALWLINMSYEAGIHQRRDNIRFLKFKEY